MTSGIRPTAILRLHVACRPASAALALACLLALTGTAHAGGQGACCTAQLGCLIATVGACANAGGMYVGDDTTCSAGVCDDGACCFPDGSCSPQLESECTAAGGTFQGTGVACGSNTCLGACCTPIGSCQDELTADECAVNAGNFFQGYGTSCDAAFCSGACCFADGTCSFVTPSDCTAAGGVHQGSAVTCNDPDCSELGVCCGNSGDCFDLVDELTCTVGGGFFQGPGTSCADLTCPQRGACCIIDGPLPCLFAIESVCAGAGGNFLGEDILCFSANCPEPKPTGACCVPLSDGVGGCTDGLTAAECADWNGSYLGDGSSCVTGICDGACCLDLSPFCVITNEATCESEAGAFAGFQTLCDDCPPPPTGACCVPESDGTVAGAGGCMDDLTESECAAWTGTWLGPDSECAVGTCNGACCYANGTCTDDLTQTQCEGVTPEFAGFGIFQGIGSTCVGADCPQPTGACCVPITDDLQFGPGGCMDLLTEDECTAWSGTWLGPDSTCNTESCDGACCLPVIGIPLSDCAEAADPEAPCVLTSEICCDDLGGEFLGFLTSCDQCELPTGACCYEDGSCTDDLTQEQCETSIWFDGEGIFQGSGSACDKVVCVVLIGACCTDDGCVDLTEGACQAIGESFAGADTLCDDLPDCDGDGLPDDCEDEPDCNENDTPDDCELDGNDCNGNGVLDECELDGNDCNGNDVPDDCELDGNDCNGNGLPDDCEEDCNDNDVPDDCETEPEPAAVPIPDDDIECFPKEFFVADDCADAEHVCPGDVYMGSTVGATNDGGLSSCDGGIPFYDVWYRYRPAWSGPAIFSYLGSPLPMAVEIYDGCPDEGGVRVGCSTSPDNDAKVVVDAKHDYWIRLGVAGDRTGPYLFEVTGPDCALNANDCNANGIPDECECLADVDGNGIVDVFDFVRVLVANGVVCNGCPEDVDGSGVVDANDVMIVLSNQGKCPFGHFGGDGEATQRGGGLAPSQRGTLAPAIP